MSTQSQSSHSLAKSGSVAQQGTEKGPGSRRLSNSQSPTASGSTSTPNTGVGSSDLEATLFNRLHPPSAIPPQKYDPTALGYSPSNQKASEARASHFARVPLEKKSELKARVARLEEATRHYVARRAQSALERSIVPGLSSGPGYGSADEASGGYQALEHRRGMGRGSG